MTIEVRRRPTWLKLVADSNKHSVPMLTRLRSLSDGSSKIQPVNTDSDGMEVTQEIGELCVGHSEPNEDQNATAVIKEEELERTSGWIDTAAEELDHASDNAMQILERIPTSRSSEHNLPPLSVNYEMQKET